MTVPPTGTQGTTSSTAAQPPASAAGGQAAPIPQKSARERLEAFASGQARSGGGGSSARGRHVATIGPSRGWGVSP
ncbi:MAG: hypothetical protein RIT28_3239 [Pseudomonadota bacterium]